MVMAWTRLFHAYFNTEIGNKYYYKDRNGRYSTVEEERKAWDLTTCIKKYGKLSKPVESNLQFFVKLRNKIEHRHIDKREIDTIIFGECQSLLFNYESELIKLFGNDYSINEALVYSLQFSQIRTKQQEKASRSVLSKDLTDIIGFVEKYRNTLSDEVYNAQEYSIKLIQIPKISNTNRTDAAVEFVRWDELDEGDKAAYEQVAVLIKDKTVKVEGANIRRFKPGEVKDKVNTMLTGQKLTQNLHVILYKVFSIRPPNGADDPFSTNAEFCLYDETHNDYVYQDAWVNFIVHFMQAGHFTPKQLRAMVKNDEKLNLAEYRN